MTKTLKLVLLAIIFFISLAFAQEADQPEAPNLLFGDFNELNPNTEEGERMMPGLYPKLRIANDFTYLTQGSDAFLNYVKNQLVPAVTSYLQAAVGNKYPLGSPISVSTPTVCGYATPQALLTGVNADLFVIYNSEIDAGASWIAAATPCMASTGVNRPIIVVIGINVPKVVISTPNDNPLNHDLNINVLTHEYIHGLGLDRVHYNNFVDSSGKPLTNHIKSVTLSGIQRTVLDLPPLTTRIRNFIGCNSIPGYFLENGASSHPETRFYQWDIMATGGLTGSKISQFTLGVLEGTGWYAIDYNYAESYFFGKGKGCAFYGDGLAASSFEEYCTGTENGCTNVGDSGGPCVAPAALEGYRVITAQPLLNCENPDSIYYTPYPEMQVYGRGKGSKCFTGNLSTGQPASQTSYCLKYTCLGMLGMYRLQVSFGATTLTCTQKGPISVPGYQGSINCPDPVKYCQTTGALSCPRNCMGRGMCMFGKCSCYSGYTGTDCGFKN